MGKKVRPPLFTVATPYPKASPVTLYSETWCDHIIVRHPEMSGQEAAVLQVASNPTIVFPGNMPNTAMFVNQEVTTPRGTPLVVIVDEQDKFIRSAYYNRAVRFYSVSQALWLSPKK